MFPITEIFIATYSTEKYHCESSNSFICEYSWFGNSSTRWQYDSVWCYDYTSVQISSSEHQCIDNDLSRALAIGICTDF